MPTTKTLKLGQKGTRELLARFGPSLLRVRYRYDEDRREPLKTVELVVKRSSREGDVESRGARSSRARDVAHGSPQLAVPERGAPREVAPRRAAPRQVALRIGGGERDLQQRVKAAGGRWNPVRRVWMARREVAEGLDLMARVVGGGGSIG